MHCIADSKGITDEILGIKVLIKSADRGHSSNLSCVSSTIGGKKKNLVQMEYM